MDVPEGSAGAAYTPEEELVVAVLNGDRAGLVPAGRQQVGEADVSKRSRHADGGGAAKLRPLGDLETVVMGHLWSAENPLTVREVLQRIEREPPLAYNTVLTVVDNLYRKGFLVREREGRAFRYQPTKDRAEHTAELMHELLSGSGDTSVTLLRFLDHMSPAQVSRLKRALRD